jgi:outer membrane protein, adhesin transport system
MKVRFLSLSIIIFIHFLPAKSQVYFGLDECIAISLERNFSILIARNNESIATNNYSPGNAGYLPSVDLTGRYNGTLNNTTQNLADGSQNTSRGVNNTTTNAGIALGWTIFNGFNVQTTYQKLNELKQLGALNTQLSIENLVSNVVSAYYAYILQVQRLKNLRYAVALSRERLRIDEERYLLGSSSKLQVLQSRVYLNADSSMASRQFETVIEAQIRLNEMMAIGDLAQGFESKDTVIDINTGLLYERLLNETMERNTSLAIASKNKIISEKDYQLVVSRSYPYVNFSSGYNYNYNTFSTGANTSQFSNGLNYGITFGVNIFDGFNQRRNIRNSSIIIENNELNLLRVDQSVRADLLALYSAYANNLRLISLEDQNLLTSTENFEIAQESYKLGSLSGLELREVQKSLLDANERLISVQFQTKLAEISLMLISGGIMEYYR